MPQVYSVAVCLLPWWREMGFFSPFAFTSSHYIKKWYLFVCTILYCKLFWVFGGFFFFPVFFVPKFKAVFSGSLPSKYLMNWRLGFAYRHLVSLCIVFSLILFNYYIVWLAWQWHKPLSFPDHHHPNSCALSRSPGACPLALMAYTIFLWAISFTHGIFRSLSGGYYLYRPVSLFLEGQQRSL